MKALYPWLAVLFLGAAVLAAGALAPAWADADKGKHDDHPPADKGGHGAHADKHDAHEHDPFDELSDGRHGHHWPILHSLGIEFSLPKWSEEGWFTGITKYMILELIACAAVALVYIPLARRISTGEPPRGAWDNAFEGLLTFIRNDVARPNLGDHDADKFVPFLWTLFLFILFNNLLGMLPWMGSPTANLYVTGALAVIAFVMMHGAAIAKMGPVHYVQSLWPHMDVPFGMGYLLKPMIFVIELLGTVIKSGVLAVRLFANMFAGHTVLAMILSFIILAHGANQLLWGTITFASVMGVVALSLLELFVAFLQAYIFVFLTALFMGMALHPQH